MKKALVIGLVGAIALVIVAKKTNVFSYASTLAAQVQSDAKKQIPTKFELERIRHEIANLDSDVSQMIRPIAEYKADIDKLRKDIARTQSNVDQKKADLLTVVEKLHEGEKFVSLGGKKYPMDRVKTQIQRETENLKLLEKNVKTQQQVLEAKETSLKATQEQLAKVVSKKREFEVRLSQLEAQDETLQIARIASSPKVDSSRATQIEDALQAVEHRLNAQKHEIEIRAGEIANIPLFEREPETLDLDAIRSYLEGNDEPAKTASK